MAEIPHVPSDMLRNMRAPTVAVTVAAPVVLVVVLPGGVAVMVPACMVMACVGGRSAWTGVAEVPHVRLDVVRDVLAPPVAAGLQRQAGKASPSGCARMHRRLPGQ